MASSKDTSDAASGGERLRRQQQASTSPRRGRRAGPRAPAPGVQQSRERASATRRWRRSDPSDRTKSPASSSHDNNDRGDRKAGEPPPGVRQAGPGDESRQTADRRCAGEARAPTSSIIADGILPPDARCAGTSIAMAADVASPAAAQAQTSARHSAGPQDPDHITGTSSPETVARFGGGPGRSGSTRLPVLVVGGHPDRDPGDRVTAQYRARAGDRDRGARWSQRLDADPKRSSASHSALVSAHLIVTGGAAIRGAAAAGLTDKALGG
jgi:hypothetical protein